MKKTILTLITIMICVIINAQIGTNIPQDRLPFDDDGILEWTKAGCLEEIRDDGGILIDIFIDVSQDLSSNVSLSQR